MGPFFQKYDEMIRKSSILASMFLAGHLFFGDKIEAALRGRNHPTPRGEDMVTVYLVSPPKNPPKEISQVVETLPIQIQEISPQNTETPSVIISQEMMRPQALETIILPYPSSPASSPIPTEKAPPPLPKPAYQPTIINLTELTPAANYQKWKGSRAIDTLVLHTTEGSGNSAKNSFLNPSHKYIAHYLVNENGEILQFAEENNVARHCKNYNQRSIGIEFAGHYDQSLTEAQLKSGAHLIQRMQSAYNISENNIKAHSDLDPSRRKDPGKANMEAILKSISSYKKSR